MVARQIPGHLTREETRQLVDSLLAERKPKPAPNVTPGPVDPLAPLWSALAQNPEIPHGNWHASYGGQGVWYLSVSLAGPDTEALMEGWFESIRSGIAAARAKRAETEQLIGKYAPKTLAEMDQADQETHHARLPRTAQDRAELEALAPKGPAPAFAWIFGADSVYAKSYAGKTWQEIGCPDPIKAIQDTVADVRKTQQDK